MGFRLETATSSNDDFPTLTGESIGGGNITLAPATVTFLAFAEAANIAVQKAITHPRHRDGGLADRDWRRPVVRESGTGWAVKVHAQSVLLSDSSFVACSTFTLIRRPACFDSLTPRE